jgi:ATP-dependent helicase/nuclease subunit A
LAVTFANKATQEMKDRILHYLHAFAQPGKMSAADTALADELKEELKLDDQAFRQNCAALLSEILHRYDQFSISTIDAFFQRVIRSFTRETQLIGDYRLEVDRELVLEEVINNLIDELRENTPQTSWIVEYAKDNLENDKAWDVRRSLMEFAKEIFREEFIAVQKEVLANSDPLEFLSGLRRKLSEIKKDFLSKVSKPALESLRIMREQGWADNEIKYSGAGLFGFLNNFGYNKDLSAVKEIGSRVQNEFIHAKNWPSKHTLRAVEIVKVADDALVPSILSILKEYKVGYQKALSAEVVLKNTYVFGLLADISRKLQEYKTENNVLLLEEAPEFLNGIIQDSDTPFIYEKIGSFFRHYLIDEFQDTSGFQWRNFFPLLTNSLDQGYSSLVVGDVKQAIYRWRSGDLTLLQEEVEKQIGPARVDLRGLNKNYRSARQIVDFNNTFFESVTGLIAAESGSMLPAAVYHDIRQTAAIAGEGFVKIDFLAKEEDGEDLKQAALERIPRQLEDLQKKGIPLSDIAILVRYNYEGQEIAEFLLEYKTSGKAVPGCLYDVVSSESLRMDGAASVNLLLAAMAYLLNSDDPIARAQLSYEYGRLRKPTRKHAEIFSVTNQAFFESQLPSAFTGAKIALRKLPLFELTETLIEIFELGKEIGELTYVQGFQDIVLDFYSRERNDLGAFLEWWEFNKEKESTSIKVSGEVPAVRVLTIHKAKGLEFPYVIVPFCNWKMENPNKEPNLWVKSDEKLFSGAGYFPVKYSSTLDKTYFQQAYREEKTRNLIDNLNLLYVAFTRAEKGLMIIATLPRRDANNSIQGWLYQGITSGTLAAGWSEATRKFNLGVDSIETNAGKKKVKPTVSLQSYASSSWRDKLVIRHAGASFFEVIKPEQRQKINFGIHLHSILSRIKFADEVPAILDVLVREGSIAEHEREPVAKEFDQLLSQPSVAAWFARGWKVKTEVPILVPGEGDSRIDRLMIKGDHAIVVDFKTGERTTADQKQVSAYIEILKRMGFANVEGYLLYTRDKEVIAIGEGKAKAVKKKNEKQLGLDF